MNEFQDAEGVLAVSAAEAKRNIERRVALTNALYDIRKAVGEVNHTAGVDAKLTEPNPYRRDIIYTIPRKRITMIGIMKLTDCSLE